MSFLAHQKIFARTLLLLAVATASAPAQDSPEKPAAGPALAPNPQQTAKDATSVNIFTGLGTTSGEGYKPLTGKQRWQYYINQNFFSVGAFLGPVLSAGLDQVSDEPPEGGGGVKGYSERLASRLGTGIIQGSTQSLGCAILGQEPRYIRSSDEGVFHRIGHAFVFSLITYNKEGKKRIAFATLGSYYVSSVATDAWFPERYTALGDGIRDGNRQVILSGFVNQFQEFWPEIRRLFRRK